MPALSKPFRRTAVAMTAVVALGVGLVQGLGPAPGGASSHREAPLISRDPAVDNTDVYAFRSPDNPGTITLISNWIPFEEPAGGPNFYAFEPGARYQFNIDNDGDAVADVVYRYVFSHQYVCPGSFLYANGPVTSLTDENLCFRETYDLTRIENGASTKLLDDAPAAPSDIGAFLMPDYAGLRAAAIRTIPAGGGRTVVGQADDPFFVDLRVFDVFGGPTFAEAGDDTLAGFNVNFIALQVPRELLGDGGDPDDTIGVWVTAHRKVVTVVKKKARRVFQQVSRLGNPLVNEAVIPFDMKDFWNRSQPKDDVANFGGAVLDPELPKVIESVFGIPAPPPPRTDLLVFAAGITGINETVGVPSEMLRINMGTPVSPTEDPRGVLGGDLAGFPNGRRLGDDVTDVALQVLMGELIDGDFDDFPTLGDGVGGNDVPFLTTFPYVALPHRGSDPDPH